MPTREQLETEVKTLVDKRNEALEAVHASSSDAEWTTARDVFISADVAMKRAIQRLENLISFEARASAKSK